MFSLYSVSSIGERHKFDPLADVRNLLQSFDFDTRVAALGLVIGFGPEITIQTGCPIEAGNIWDLKYMISVKQSLAELVTRMPISVEAVNTVAKNVFRKRNTLRPLDYFPSLMCAFKVKEFIFTTNGDMLNEAMTVAEQSLFNICRNHHLITDFTAGPDHDLGRVVDEQINSLTNNNNRFFKPSDWKSICFIVTDCIKGMCNGLRIQTGLDDEKEDLLIKNIIRSHFGDALFSQNKYTQLACQEDPIEFTNILKAFKELRWTELFDNLTGDKPALENSEGTISSVDSPENTGKVDDTQNNDNGVININTMDGVAPLDDSLLTNTTDADYLDIGLESHHKTVFSTRAL